LIACVLEIKPENAFKPADGMEIRAGDFQSLWVALAGFPHEFATKDLQQRRLKIELGELFQKITGHPRFERNTAVSQRSGESLARTECGQRSEPVTALEDARQLELVKLREIILANAEQDAAVDFFAGREICDDTDKGVPKISVVLKTDEEFFELIERDEQRCLLRDRIDRLHDPGRVAGAIYREIELVRNRRCQVDKRIRQRTHVDAAPAEPSYSGEHSGLDQRGLADACRPVEDEDVAAGERSGDLKYLPLSATKNIGIRLDIIVEKLER